VYATSFLVATERYGDYRNVDGLQLPFRVANSRANLAGNSDGEAVDTVEQYRLWSSVPAAALHRPDGKVRDVTMANGAREATTPMRVE
ncbi:hypothetical protein, partial [Salmonella enterica]|uniref:hypothetical protein n=1 Tax=Salmonella enterica TaxID=28901 RepID=UPI0021B3CD25